ncbi:MAG: ATP phosphoribosyltransferase [Deltaproteobacteria bacterium]|jgi:ATP phosphoribosyltransferase|nr:ATP phosphoribosyltransferase [Deltaproteobacteria bacterium]
MTNKSSDQTPLIRLGLPKGSLEDYTMNLFARSGWRINVGSRNYFPAIDDPEISCTLCRVQEMTRYVASGVLDAGFTGKDWRLENGLDVAVIADLKYSKASPTCARWVLAVPGDGSITSAKQLDGAKIATELPGITKKWFADQGVSVDVEFSWGATEAKVVNGLADAIVEVTETGSTIRAHGLRIIDEVMTTYTEFVANPITAQDPRKMVKIQQIALLLKGALAAEGLVGLKLNVREKDAPKVIALLPSLNAPTVAHLYQTDWLSVEVVIASKLVRDLLPTLLANGAEGIIEYPLNKVV